MTLVFAFITATLSLVFTALAQGGAEVDGSVVFDPENPYPQLANMTAILGANALAVQFVKRLVENVKVLRDVPIWVYSVFSAVALTLFARYVLNTIEHEIGPLLWFAAINAASSSGFYTWIRKGKETPGNRVAALILVSFMFVGCSSDRAFFHAAEQYHISTESWLDSIDRDDLLTDEEKQLRHENWKAHDRLLEAKRQEIAAEF